ncbi:DUF1490 family protein [Mycobacterium sp. THU-M104]|uniref:DUF1490 family protein n=1 Tax=unclassified Mycobacterium TaxID=2642494 RepID=UPI003B990AD8
MAYGMFGRGVAWLATGVVGAAAYDLVVRAAKKAPLHQAAVSAAELGLRGTRKAEEAAESARLKMSDVMAEARGRIGEEAPTPAVGDAHDHDH